MHKSDILTAILKELDDELRRFQGANKEASASATDSEFKAESQWDTGGLEASYLARGYAQQFARMSEQAKRLRAFSPPDFSGKAIGTGALVECDLDGFTSMIFLLPCAGGLDLVLDEHEITTVTPDSPLGKTLMGKRQGDAYTLPSGMTGRIRQVR
jgi:transcription elongation GreA/GreB family factor